MNGARGEVHLEIEGVERSLCLTLGALAEIESAFGCATLTELQSRLVRLSASEIEIVLKALLKGGGEVCEVKTVSPGLAAKAIADAFHAALV